MQGVKIQHYGNIQRKEFLEHKNFITSWSNRLHKINS